MNSSFREGQGKITCRLVVQGYELGSCLTKTKEGRISKACEITLRYENGMFYRLIKSAMLSRPEDYFSIYQSGCNHTCLKCHSWYFTQIANGYWVSTNEIAEMVADYEMCVTVKEPRKRATMWHATDLCRHCGSCVVKGKPGEFCPKKLDRGKIVLSPQGYGPARNIVAFTGGDIVCCAEFYAEATEKIKEMCKNMWVLIETNGYGLTPKNLDILADAGVDSFWLDIKAYDEKIYKKLCGTTNKWILKAPERILDRGFVLEVSTLYIPGWVEEDQIGKIAKLLVDLDPEIPFTILAFFPEYKLKVRPPTLMEMLKAYNAAEEAGLKNIKIGNYGVFVKSEEDLQILLSTIGLKALG